MHSTRAARLQATRLVTRATTVLLVAGLALPAFAQGMSFGGGLLTWAAANIIAPLGVLSVVVALGASIIRPDLVRGAIYTAIICAAIFFIVRMSSTLVGLLQS